MFSKILVANRGEIAVRVIKTAQALGYRTVAVFSDADADAPHVLLADEAVHLGPSPVGQSYLCMDKLLQAAQQSGADAIHPGYGFLSENAAFAQACAEQGLTFIGPPVEAIRLMGSKRLSKIAMLEADVPCIPGYEGADQSDDTLCSEAMKIGLPVMIKASAGGGGRGMRLVQDENSLLASIRTARSEATHAFGSGELILEKAIINPRHIEIQVFADQQGNCVYLGERDCSIQRRHQKVVEEAPSPFVDDALRQRMGEAAVQAAKSCHYVGAGTVEFLVDENRHFYFLEMNTRLQVEHPVTELITGTDLVAWQLRVASGQPLPLTQAQVTLTGHAIEVRFYAEDPAQNFLPQTGEILHWQPAEGVGIRIDSGIRSGQQISPHYDPMLAKIIAYGQDREEARRRLVRTLEDSQLFGLTVNSRFLRNLVCHPEFIAGKATTAFIQGPFAKDDSLLPHVPTTRQWALAALARHLCQNARHGSGWRVAHPTPWPYELRCGESLMELALTASEGQFIVSFAEETILFEQVSVQPDNLEASQGIQRGTLLIRRNGVLQRAQYLVRHEQVFLHDQGQCLQFNDLTLEAAKRTDAGGSGQLNASMDGAIVDVLVNPGDTVKKGQTLIILEAMKMEHQLKADCDGTVAEVHISKGQQVKIRQPLVVVS